MKEQSASRNRWLLHSSGNMLDLQAASINYLYLNKLLCCTFVAQFAEIEMSLCSICNKSGCLY